MFTLHRNVFRSNKACFKKFCFYSICRNIFSIIFSEREKYLLRIICSFDDFPNKCTDFRTRNRHFERPGFMLLCRLHMRYDLCACAVNVLMTYHFNQREVSCQTVGKGENTYSNWLICDHMVAYD